MRKTSIVLQCAALAAVASIAALPAGANAPVKPAPAHMTRVVAASATATPKPAPTPKPYPTCGPPVDTPNAMNPMSLFQRMNPFVQHCPV